MPFARDTRPEARALLLARLRGMSPAERFAATADLVQAGLQLALLGTPDAAADPAAPEARARFLRRWLGRALAEPVLAEIRRRAGTRA